MSDDQDFASMLEHDGHAQMRRGFNPGEKVRGTVVAVTRNSILLDINAKSEGVLDRALLEEEDGKLSVKVGDEMDAYVVGADKGEISLTTRLRGQDLESGELRNAFDAQIPVEGKVTGTNTAGLEVTIAGKRGFCPVSQIEIFRVEEKDVYVGQTMTFLILEYDENNLVVSRRAYLQKLQQDQRQQLEEGLREGDNVTGTVRKVADFGVFVELGGADGLIPMGELAWERVADANTVVKLGDKVTVKVIKLDWPKNRITLSLRQAGSDPWEGIEAKLMVGMSYKGKVTRLADFGAFVQLEPGIEGLLHISKLGAGRRIGHPREVVEAGQELGYPTIVAFGEAYLPNMGLDEVFGVVNAMARRVEIPLVLHLDHCKSFENIVKAIRAGFTSVMFDGSSLPFEKNMEATAQVVAMAHAAGVSVEAELGALAGGEFSNEESGEEIYTNPGQAGQFVSRTGIDALAVSIGTVHGMYKGTPKIDVGVLKKIAAAVDIPLVLHGGSGTPEEIVRECIRNGIAKINVNTEISFYTVEKVKALLDSGKSYHLSQLALKEVGFIKEVVNKYATMFRSA